MTHGRRAGRVGCARHSGQRRAAGALWVATERVRISPSPLMAASEESAGEVGGRCAGNDRRSGRCTRRSERGGTTRPVTRSKIHRRERGSER